jgi:hypothetical protein
MLKYGVRFGVEVTTTGVRVKVGVGVRAGIKVRLGFFMVQLFDILVRSNGGVRAAVEVGFGSGLRLGLKSG